MSGLEAIHRSEIAQQIVKFWAVNPYCTIKKVAASHKVAFSTAQRAVIKLESLGILSQDSIGKRDRVYCAHAILSILEEPTKITNNYDADEL